MAARSGMDKDIDLQIRTFAFSWLAEKRNSLGEVLPRALLQTGFQFQGERIPLVAPQGIFRPRLMTMPLSITTTPQSPYDDSFGHDNLLRYRYRGNDPEHPDNAGLRRALSLQRPLVYFHGIVPGKYLAVWPVFIVADHRTDLSFTVAVDNEVPTLLRSEHTSSTGPDSRRAYLTSTVKVRLHQHRFREMVLEAYRTQCALCRLKHRELLDAAHIIPDSEESGEPIVSNGLALCKLHHAAYDSFLLSVSPDYMVELRRDVLDEEDGPMLQYGLKDLQGTRLNLPVSRADWPGRDLLAERFELFKKSAWDLTQRQQ